MPKFDNSRTVRIDSRGSVVHVTFRPTVSLEPDDDNPFILGIKTGTKDIQGTQVQLALARRWAREFTKDPENSMSQPEVYKSASLFLEQR